MTHPAEKLKEPLVADKPILVELVGNGAQIVVARDLNGRFNGVFVERAHVVCQQPAHTGQNRRNDQYECKPQRKAAALALPFQFLPLGAAARGAVLRAHFRFADAFGVPAGGLVVVILVAHRSSLLGRSQISQHFWYGQAHLCALAHRIVQSMTSEVNQKMCNNNNNCLWLILIVILILCCGGCGNGSTCGSGCNCGNSCGCGGSNDCCC